MVGISFLCKNLIIKLPICSVSKCFALYKYSQLSPCGHLAITDTPIIRTATKSPAKINYRRLTEINYGCYGPSLLRTLTHGTEGVCNKGS